MNENQSKQQESEQPICYAHNLTVALTEKQMTFLNDQIEDMKHLLHPEEMDAAGIIRLLIDAGIQRDYELMIANQYRESSCK